MIHEPIDIKCPFCCALAKFEEPFEFLSKSRKELSPNETHPHHQWGGWIVVERFPSQISWKPPSGSSQYVRSSSNIYMTDGYPVLTNGLIQCSSCHTSIKHKLTWPEDAYWQWEVRGQFLWAWDKGHALSILDFVKNTVRPSQNTCALRYIPSHFLSAKIRELVVKKMERSINA